MGAIAIVPAAGRAERFGGGKLIADIGGEPLLNRTLRSLLDGGVGHIVVVLAPGATFVTVDLLMNDPRVVRVINPKPARGMLSSIQIGLAAADGDPILVLPGDMPFVSSATVAAVLAAAVESGSIVSPSFQGRHGHPVALPARMREDIVQAESPSTLALLIASHAGERRAIDVDDPGVLRDVDTGQDVT
ncbi:MAG TPA: nucleotidyltransferase family protein [Vicinamibacterales bacterium]|nr:nucleotidyltransferase family protein [Vicinamibacterales bacterium]